MPFRLRNEGKNKVVASQLDYGLTAETKPEAVRKASQIREYYMKQDTFLEKYNALNEIFNRAGDLFAFSDNNNQGDFKEIGDQLGYRLPQASYRETQMRDDACFSLATDSVKDLSGLQQLFIAQGMLQAGYKAEMELERRKYLSEFPEDDPLREQKADYLVEASDGAYGKHFKLRNTTTMITQEFYDISWEAYSEFSGNFERRTGKNIREMTLREFADRLDIPEEKRSEFYRKFDYDGVTASPEDKFVGITSAKSLKENPSLTGNNLNREVAERFYNEFYAAMIEKGVQMARSVMSPKKQKLMDAGRHYDNTDEAINRQKIPALKEWIKKEGGAKARANALENVKKRIFVSDQTVLRNSKKGGVALQGNIERISYLDNEGAYCLSYNKMEQTRARLQNAATHEEKTAFAAEYLLAKQINEHLTQGNSIREYPTYKVRAMYREIQERILQTIDLDHLTGKDLVNCLDAPAQMEAVKGVSNDLDDGYDVSHERYIELHTGKRAGETPEEKVENLAKCLAAYALKKNGQKFSVKQIHKYAGLMKKTYALDTLVNFPDRLNEALKDYDSVLKSGRELRECIYGVKEENYPSYAQSMKELAKSMVDPKGHSKEYKKLVECVRKAAALERSMAGKSSSEKAEMIRKANLNIIDASEKYMQGKEKVRFGDEGKACFNNALDAAATVGRFAQGVSVRTSGIITGINEIRNRNNPGSSSYIDMNRLTEEYGPERAKQALLENPGKFRAASEVQAPGL